MVARSMAVPLMAVPPEVALLTADLLTVVRSMVDLVKADLATDD
jgi:hypothetical protein